jgi:hypothetical protein
MMAQGAGGTVREAAGDHAIDVPQPTVADIIEAAAIV